MRLDSHVHTHTYTPIHSVIHVNVHFFFSLFFLHTNNKVIIRCIRCYSLELGIRFQDG